MKNSAPNVFLEIIPLGILVTFSLLSLFEIYKLVLVSPNDLHYKLNFAFSDYLINYSGGFVRRGFLGELLSFLGEGRIVPAFNIYLMALFTVNFGLLVYLTRVTTVSFLVPSLAILMPMGLVSISVYADLEIFARKEMIFYCFTTYCAVQSVKNYRLIYGESHNAQLLNSKLKIFIAQIFIFSIFAMLSHEGFAFYSVPTLLVLLSVNALRLEPRRRITILVLYTILIFLLSIILFFNRGTPDIRIAIIASLPDGLRGYHEAIDLIGWHPSQQLTQSLNNFFVNSKIVLFQALPVLIIYLSLFAIFCRKYSRYHLTCIDPVIQGAFLFIVISASMGPYFLLSGDWTRLVTSIAINSSLLILVFSSIDRRHFERTFFISNRGAGIISFKLVPEACLKDNKFAFVVVLLMFWVASTFRIFGSDLMKMNGNLVYQARAFARMIQKTVFDAAIDLPAFIQYF